MQGCVSKSVLQGIVQATALKDEVCDEQALAVIRQMGVQPGGSWRIPACSLEVQLHCIYFTVYIATSFTSGSFAFTSRACIAISVASWDLHSVQGQLSVAGQRAWEWQQWRRPLQRPASVAGADTSAAAAGSCAWRSGDALWSHQALRQPS